MPLETTLVLIELYIKSHHHQILIIIEILICLYRQKGPELLHPSTLQHHMAINNHTIRENKIRENIMIGLIGQMNTASINHINGVCNNVILLHNNIIETIGIWNPILGG